MLPAKVGMITGRFYPDYSGGARQALAIARVLLSKKMPVTVFTLDMNRSIWFSPTTLDYVEDIPVYRIPGRARTRLEIVVRYARFVFECWRRRKLFDIVHAHGLIEGYLSLFLSKLSGKPALAKLAGVAEITSHWFENGTISEEVNFSQNGISLSKRIQQYMTRKLDHVVCTTSKQYVICKKIGLTNAQLALIPNGVDIRRFPFSSAAVKTELRRRFGWSPGEFVAITVLSLRPIKGLDILLAAWLQLKSPPRRRLVVIGPNEAGMTAVNQGFADDVRRQAAQAPKHAPVTFLGQVNDVQPYLAAADAFVLPSRSEGFPNAALEAMACGLPCIFSAISWSADVVEDEVNALLFIPEDSEHLCHQLNQLLKNKAMRFRLGRAARKTVEKRFAIEAVAEQYRRLYRQLLEDNH